MNARPLRKTTNEEISSMNRDGAVLLKSMLSQEWTDKLTEGLEYTRNNPEGMSLGIDAPLRIDQFPSTHSPGLKEIIDDSPIAEIIGSILNAPVRFYMDQMSYKPAGLIPWSPWHQDTC